MYRRQFLLSLASVGFSLTPSAGVSSQRAGTVFNIVWRDLEVGYSSINIVKNYNQIIASIDVKIDVVLLGIKFFSYTLECQEIWENKKLLSLKSEVFVGKKREFAHVKKVPNGFEISGSGFSGIIDGNPATTSYFTPDFLKRNVWISTQNGKPLKVQSKMIGTEELQGPTGKITATNWEVSGDLNINLYYNQDNEWVGSNFKVGGSRANFLLHNKIGRSHQLWETS